ncbi:MAG TPA: hypothetical protein VHE33_17140, partial [Acidobacteriaceae bacterium]|nr:hypothetical protein [Acidobacteriaceae bacterium]
MRGDEELNRSRDAIDERIDLALRSYAEPPEFPDTRVMLARVMQSARDEETRRRGWWFWGAAVPAGLAVMATLVVMWTMRSPRHAEIAWTPKTPAVAESIVQRLKPESSSGSRGAPQAVALKHGGRREAGLARTEERNPLPKQDVFPEPRPLSAQEEALVAFASHVPAKV